MNHPIRDIALQPKRTIGPLYTESQFKDTKDPCVLFDGTRWHLYGSGGSVREEHWHILHAIADDLLGPWHELPPVTLEGLAGEHVAAPSVVYDEADGLFHMYVQTEFLSIGGTIEYLVSSDGDRFVREKTIISSLRDSPEAGIYDPHQAIINGDKYCVYAGTPAIEGVHGQFVIQPDIYLAQSETNSWGGPWKRLGKILDHDDIEWHHNPRHHHEYEWGIEGPQIVALAPECILLNATCFLKEGRFGTRQRVFFALASSVAGPYISLGPILPQVAPNDEAEEWQSGENGHATVVVKDGYLYLFYQARSRTHAVAQENNWRYGVAVFAIDELLRLKP